MKKQVIAFTLSLMLIPALHAGWGNGTATHSQQPQGVARQIEKLINSINTAINRGSASSIVSPLVTALENFGYSLPDIMYTAQQNGTQTALKAQFRQLAAVTHRLIEIHEPDRSRTCKKMLAIIYANHPPAQAHAPEHAPCHKTLALGWHPGAIVGLWEHYVEGTPHAANLITFCSTCMADLREILDDAARRKQECTRLKNALWQFEQQL